MVLVVDDNKDTATAVRYLLRKRGFDAELLLDARDAVDFVHRSRPTLVILDHMMPGMTGLDVLRRLRADPETQDIPVLLYSAALDPASRSEALRLGAVDWIVKGGLSWDGLLGYVTRYVNGSASPTGGAAATAASGN